MENILSNILYTHTSLSIVCDGKDILSHLITRSRVLLGKSARCYKAELFYDVVDSKRRHWFAVTLSFTPFGDRQTDLYKRLSDDRQKA